MKSNGFFAKKTRWYVLRNKSGLLQNDTLNKKDPLHKNAFRLEALVAILEAIRMLLNFSCILKDSCCLIRKLTIGSSMKDPWQLIKQLIGGPSLKDHCCVITQLTIVP